MNKELLQARKVSKRNKPLFTRQDSHKIKSLSSAWRFPRGMHSKIRKQLRGYMRHPSIGWSSPKEVRGLTPQGFETILVYAVEDLENMKVPITIAGTVGMRKRVEIVKKAVEKKIAILNIKDPQAFLKEVEQKLTKRKEQSKNRVLKKKKVEEQTKKIEEKKKEAKEETPEEKEKREKEAQKKILEQK